MSQNLQQLLAAANAVIDTIAVHDAIPLIEDTAVQFVDIRDTTEIAQTGMLPGALHAPRGFLEFIADSQTSMHAPEFASGKRLIVYCASGGRSVLAAKTLVDMGIPNVWNLAGGFAAWQEANGPIQSAGS